MPLATAGQDVRDAVGTLMATLPTTQQGIQTFHAGAQWAMVATAFFGNGDAPAWSPAGMFTAEQIFGAIAGKSITPASFAEAFAAYAAVASGAGATVPIALSTPPGIPDLAALLSLPSQVDHVPAADTLYNALLGWAIRGTIPGVPPLPWI